MFSQLARRKVVERFAQAGIVVNGPAPHDLTVRNDALYTRLFWASLFKNESIAFGESYMDGWWECPQIDQLIYKFLARGPRPSQPLLRAWRFVWHRVRNPQSPRRSRRVAKEHYDLDVELYRGMLGKYLAYSCGYWREAQTLDDAQAVKFDLICRKLDLKPGDRVLEIGCGFGEFAKYAAEHYGVEVVGVTISAEQLAEGQRICAGVSGVDLRLMDYRALEPGDFPDLFDYVVSIGMFEHVGPRNYRAFMQVASRMLKPAGKMLLHTIGGSGVGMDPWIDRYIFPGGMLPTLGQIISASDGPFEIVADVHNFGAYYDPTLMSWYANFLRIWPDLQKLNPATYTNRFLRMWTFYLLSCAGGFRAGKLDLWQVVLLKESVPGGYHSVR